MVRFGWNTRNKWNIKGVPEVKQDEATLEQEFVRLTTLRSQALARNDSRSGNRYYDKLYKLKGTIRQLPNRGEALLKRVLDSLRDGEVRVMAAAYLLAVDEGTAFRELEAVAAEESGLVSMNAEMTLKEWKAGRLRDYLA